MRKFISLGILAIVLLVLAGLALGQGVVVEPETSWAKPEGLQGVITPAMALGIDKSDGGLVALEPLDTGALLIEDEEDQLEGGKPLRIGIHRQMPDPSFEDWLVVADTQDYYVIRLIIYAPGALMIRPHFASFPSLEEASVYCYGQDEDLAEGPIRKNSTVKSLDFWGPPMAGDYYYIECAYPFEPTPDQYPLVDKISHIYRDAFGLGLEDKEGACNIDVMCADSTQRSLASGVAAIAAETSSSTGFCTGCLLADEVDSTQVPYFLTANHCQVTSANAPSTYFYFRFQTSACNGSPPSMRSTTRTDGATHMASYEPSDVTLLKLAENPPSGSTFAGYKTSTIGQGVDTTCIHHPRGTYKRITYGYTRSWGGASGYDEANHITSRWTSGTTEPGSSGSPLFDGVYVIGQLHGGPGACDAGSYNYDYYGRFSVSYTNGLSTYLTGQGGSGEGNTVTVLSQGVSLGYHETEVYSVTIPVGATNITASITDVSGDADLYTRYSASPTTSLYDCRPYSGSGVDETCSHDNPTPGTWYVMAGVIQRPVAI